MIRQATLQDLPALLDFLRPRVATSMFLSANLHDHGLNATGHPKATTVWIAEEDGAVQAVFGCTQRGFLNCEAPAFNPDWSAELRHALSGRRVIGMSGEAGQMRALRRALGLATRAVSFEDTEPHFQLDLADLIPAPGDTDLRVATTEDAALVVGWRWDYDREIHGDDDTPEIRQQSQDHAMELLQTGRLRLLEQGLVPVAMTGFNAALPEIVQIGSVYTPPALRGQGHARRAVALHLAEARKAGVTSAVLFAAGPAAVRAYESIGFTRIGAYTQVLFAIPLTTEPPV